MRRIEAVGFMVAAALGVAGCSDPTASGPPPVAVATLEIITNTSSNPRLDFDATCQTGAIVRLKATGSHDPSGHSVTFRWRDTVEGDLSHDFGPIGNPFETNRAETGVVLASLGAHEIELTVTASDGRKARTVLNVYVTSCEECSPPRPPAPHSLPPEDKRRTRA